MTVPEGEISWYSKFPIGENVVFTKTSIQKNVKFGIDNVTLVVPVKLTRRH